MGKVMRAPGWEQRLHALIAERRTAPFEWGRQDCCQFVLAALQALRGPESAPTYSYATVRGACRVLASLGGIPGAAARHVGPEIPPGLAGRGDVVMVRSPDERFGHALAVVTGAEAYAPGPDGLVPIPRGQWLRAWRA